MAEIWLNWPVVGRWLADGRPDLQGVWDFRTATPLERPQGMGERLTEEQAAAFEAGAAAASRKGDSSGRRWQGCAADLGDARRR